MIQFTNVSKQYDNGVIALSNINLRIEQGEFVYIVGPSGSGKSSLMKLIYREEHASQGTIQVGKFKVTKIKERDIANLRRSLGVIFQDFKLLPRLTVFENIAYAMEVTGASSKQIKKRVHEVLDLVGLRHKFQDYPDNLSGGEQQRVAIARALVNHPSILVADEPTGNLDPENALEIFRLLERINQSGTTVVLGTHNDQLVDSMRHRIIRLDHGRIVNDEYKGDYHAGL